MMTFELNGRVVGWENSLGDKNIDATYNFSVLLVKDESITLKPTKTVDIKADSWQKLIAT